MIDNKSGKIIKDRRKGPDLLVKCIQVSNAIVWITILAITIITQNAKPQVATIFDRAFDVRLRTTWDRSLLQLGLVLMFFLLLFSIISIIINRKRLKRKSDRIRLSFIFSIILSCFGIILYLSLLL